MPVDGPDACNAVADADVETKEGLEADVADGIASGWLTRGCCGCKTTVLESVVA